ncbi:MAG: glycosyltransferase, partial [Thermoanaerobaculia bacterium]
PSIHAEVPAVRYLVAGDGDDRARVEALATSLGVRDLVTFCGFVPDDELADHYRLADVFVMPSRGEGFGIVFLEAMACGTRVVAGNVDGSRDAIGHELAGATVDPSSQHEIAECVLKMLAVPLDAEERVRVRAAAMERHGRQEFDGRIITALRNAVRTGRAGLHSKTARARN